MTTLSVTEELYTGPGPYGYPTERVRVVWFVGDLQTDVVWDMPIDEWAQLLDHVPCEYLTRQDCQSCGHGPHTGDACLVAIINADLDDARCWCGHVDGDLTDVALAPSGSVSL